jgi:very-short-patch-repair endonuclease
VVKYSHPSENRTRARRFRREPTDAERKLWFLLRDRRLSNAKFRRQVLIGSYIVDFVCLKHKVIVEADGGQHAGNARDLIRDRWLAKEGYTVLRYYNHDILTNSGGVLLDMIEHFRVKAPPHPASARFARLRPPSPPEGRGEQEM